MQTQSKTTIPLLDRWQNAAQVFPSCEDTFTAENLELLLGEGSHPVAYRLALLEGDEKSGRFMITHFVDAVTERNADKINTARKAIFEALEHADKVSPYALSYALDKIEAIVDGSVDEKFPHKAIFSTPRSDRELDEQSYQNDG